MLTRLNPQTSLIARGERNGTLSIYQRATSQMIWLVEAHNGPVTTLEWSPDGCWLASGGRDGMVHFWRVATGDRQYSFVHGRAVKHLCWSPDSAGLVATSGQTIHLVRLPLPITCTTP